MWPVHSDDSEISGLHFAVIRVDGKKEPVRSCLRLLRPGRTRADSASDSESDSDN